MTTHIVPVGFDYDRLIAPLIRDQFTVDRVVLLEGAVGSEANVEYSRNLAEKLEGDFQNLLGAETERLVLADVYDYDAAFVRGYDLINAELDAGSEVWVNVSSIPRPVSFALATAAHSIILERGADRERLHTYYTAPEKYLETELAEELRDARSTLSEVAEGNVDEAAVDERLESIGALLAEFDEEYTDSFRSKVIYNVDRLGPGGKAYLEQEEHGNSHRTSLSRIGELWVRAHADDPPEALS
ncbi:DUF6293 family protein [Halolamina sp.]|uniref:HFX_2341 family transcriptional regulator domain-containing protein n=1 Tax=Halolamina sp. TaxID=1940283 RepID=UPI003567D80A